MEFLIISVVGAALVMDTTAVFQVMASQPIVACTIIGWMMGDPFLGLKFGLLLQLLWIGNLPVGASIVPAGNFAAIISTAVAISLTSIKPELKSFIILITISYALILSYAGSKIIRMNHSWNIMFFDKALESINSGNLRKISIINFSALLLHFIIISVLILGGIILGVTAGSFIVGSVPAKWDFYARYSEYAILGIGVGLTTTLYTGFKRIIIIALGIIAGAMLYYI